jgi:GNAT superfamily N-acetyltransferase
MQEPVDDEEAFGALGLRPATAEDEPFLRNLFASTRANELALMTWDEHQKAAFVAMQFKAQSRQFLTSYPHANDSIVLFKGEPVGRMLVARTEATIFLVDIALLTDYRNLGLGTGLIQGLLKEAAIAGKPVRLHVFAASVARRLYERLGFSQIGVDSGYLEMMWFPPGSRS